MADTGCLDNLSYQCGETLQYTRLLQDLCLNNTCLAADVNESLDGLLSVLHSFLPKDRKVTKHRTRQIPRRPRQYSIPLRGDTPICIWHTI